jgi:DNA (cytosine-5)-methyltransferase 1
VLNDGNFHSTINFMKKDIDILELFSGIGGFSKGFLDAGYTIKNHSFSEIDKHAIANYKYNFKDAESIGSVTDVRGLKTPDVLTFGSPCQDFSLAGKRMGMEGQRSSLITEAIRLITELRPTVFIWENVKGTFSSNDGQDFWAIISAFANIGGYRLEWQLLNTSWFLPQNRERIYLIGHLDGTSKPGVFPIISEDINSFKTQSTYNAPTIMACYGKIPTDGFYIASATKSGFELAKEGDSINFSNPNSETRRGRVGKGVAQTLDTACNQGVISVATPGRKEKNQNCKALLTSMHERRIRRLTEIECERLQGFPDDWTKYGDYNGEIKEISRTQRYKMCGNAVTVAVVKAIAERLSFAVI